MNTNANTILIVLSILVVVSYVFNYFAAKLKVPSVLLLVASGIGLKFSAEYFQFQLPPTDTLLEILGITGLIFIVLEASLDLSIERKKLPLIGRAFVSAIVLLGFTSGLIALVFMNYYETDFRQALIHALPLSVISSAVAIPSVQGLDEEKKEFVIYESTFSDIVGIIAFNYLIIEHSPGIAAVGEFGVDILLIVIISILSTVALVFLLNHATTNVRFFLTFAILILTYALSKLIHLPSLILILCFGLVLGNFKLFDFPLVHRFFSMDRLNEVTRELKTMTSETAFIIRTFFFLLFGYSINLEILGTKEVIVMGLVIITLTILVRFVFLRFVMRLNSAPLYLIAPRGLITILLFYSIPANRRLESMSEGVLFVVIVFTGLAMTVGLLLNKRSPEEKIEDVI